MAFSVAGTIRRQAAERGDATAVTFQDRTLTFRDLDERSSRAAQGLAEAGVGSQDRIAFLDKNCPEYFDVLFGGAKLNAVGVAVNWRLAPPEILYTVNDAQATVLFVGEEFVPALDAIEDRLEHVKKIVVLGKHPKHESYEDWIARFPAEDPGVESAPDDVAFQLYTSGTTGLPKGAMLTNSNMERLMDALPGWGFRPDGVSLVVMPLFHIAGGGWAFAGVYSGCHSVMLREVDPAEILAVIPRYGVTNAIFVPALLQFLLIMPNVNEVDCSSLEYILYGASPISEEVLRTSMQTFGCRFVQAYGLTETTGGFTILPPEDHDPENRPELLRSAGKPFPWVELRMVDPDTGREVAEGEIGEIWTRSEQNMKGYWNMPEATAEVITSDGWLRTGDAGYLKDGYLYLYDRTKDMVVSGGENVYPAEVENALMSHPAVADVAVIGVPDPKWGETVKAIVVRTEGAEASERELIDFCRERLARYKCPTTIDFVEGPLPRNPSGKLLKRVLREPYWKGAERRIQ